MKISERLLEITGEPKNPPYDNYDRSNLTEDQVKKVEEALIDYLGFKEIKWMDLPAGLITNSKGEEQAVVAKTFKVSEDSSGSYKGRTCYLYKVLYTSDVFDPIDMTRPIDGEMIITPLLNDIYTVKAFRTIAISWSPIDLFINKEIEPITWEHEKQYLINKLETLLSNPENYKPKGEKKLILRFALDKSEE